MDGKTIIFHQCHISPYHFDGPNLISGVHVAEKVRDGVLKERSDPSSTRSGWNMVSLKEEGGFVK